MKKILFIFGMLCLVFPATTARGGQVGVDLDIHLGNHPPSPPIAVEPSPVMVEYPPEMVYVDGLRVYVAVGIPYDLFFYNDVYYYHVNGIWYRSAYYRGPWVPVVYRGIPPGLRQHRIEEIREFRHHAWEDYREHGEHFRGRHFRALEVRDRHRHERR